MTDKHVKPKDAASVLIIRDGEAHPKYGTLQILMVKRHRNMKFAGGAYVFPGGKVDAADFALEEKTLQLSDKDISEEFYGFRFAALREIFEETGLVIGTLDGQPIGEDIRKSLDGKYRADFLAGEITLAEFLERAGVVLDMSDCLPFAHWITPEVSPIRFDTRFFLCVAPDGQIPSPDGQEITHVEWMHPMTLVEESDGILMFPTMMNLKKLGQAKTVSQALKLLSEREIITVIPEVITGVKDRFRRIPDDAGYEDIDQSRTRPAGDFNKT